MNIKLLWALVGIMVLASLGMIAAPVSACACGQSFFFNGAEDGSWTNTNNWWLDTGFTVPASGVPGDSDDANIYATVNSSGPTPTVAHLNVYGTALFFIAINVTDNATFHDTSSLPGRVYGTADFYNSSQSGFFANIGSHVGDYTFHDSSRNAGVLNGNATFKDASSNTSLVTGNADVYYPSANPIGGAVLGTVTYHNFNRTMYYYPLPSHDWSDLNNWYDDQDFLIQSNALPNPTDTVVLLDDVLQNSGDPASVKTLIATSSTILYVPITVSENASFYDRSCIAGDLTAVRVDLYGSSCNGGEVTGDLYLHDLSVMGGGVTGNAYYDTSFYNGAPPTGGVFTVSGAYVLLGRVSGTAYGADNAPITKYVFRDTSTNDAYLVGTYEFYDTTNNDMATIPGDAYFYNSSENFGEVDGNVFFHDSSRNSGNIGPGFTASFFDSSSNSTYAYLNGDADVYYPAQRPLAGTILGAIRYHNYPQDAPVVSTPAFIPSYGGGGNVSPAVFAQILGNHPPAPKVAFAQDLQIGSQGGDVKTLQKYLNTHGYMVAATGSGSPGKETSTFGPATKNALIRFQKANHISPASGYFGPVTRGVVNGK